MSWFTSDKPAPQTTPITLESNIHQPKTKVEELKGFNAIVGRVPPQVLECAEMLKNMEAYHRMGARLPRGLLMVGPPGTGKTRIAKALAEESSGHFVFMSATEFNDKYFGSSERKVRNVFKDLEYHDKSVLFIDEIDALGSRNSEVPMWEGSKKVLTEFLVQMDGLSTNPRNKNSLIIGATNDAAALDPALKRPGRFDQIVEVPLPDCDSRHELIKFYLSFTRHNTSSITDDFIKGVAAKTENCSPADIRYIVNEGAILAVKEKADAITQNHLLEAIERFHERNVNAGQRLTGTFIKHSIFNKQKTESDVAHLQQLLSKEKRI
jgi:cell division protease FtsH